MKLLNNWISKFSPEYKKEQQALRLWKEKYLEEVNALQQLHPNEDLSKKAKKYKDFEPEKAWDRFENEIQLKPRGQRRIVGLYQYMKWAAVFLIVASGLWFWKGSGMIHSANQNFVAGNSKLTFELNDKSGIALMPDAALHQTAYRQVELMGRASFDITKDAENPFIITTKHATIKVYGTSFNLSSSNDSTWIHLTRGSVELFWDGGSKILKPGDKAVVSNYKLLHYSEGHASVSDWEHNILLFDNVELVEALKVVAEHYNVLIVWPLEKASKSCLIKTRFQNSTLSNVLKELSLITNFEYEIKDQKIIVTRMGC